MFQRRGQTQPIKDSPHPVGGPKRKGKFPKQLKDRLVKKPVLYVEGHFGGEMGEELRVGLLEKAKRRAPRSA